jgi:hypothetical protein
MYSSSCPSTLRQTHTCATLEVPQDMWDLVAKALTEAGYEHAFSHDGTMLDMSGIGLVKKDTHD